MKRIVSFLLAVVLLLGAVPVVGVSAADVKTSDPDVITFEQWTAGSDLSSVFASGTTMATVGTEQAKEGSQSAELKDTSTSSAAILRYETEGSSFLDLSFDMFLVVGGLQFRISNGSRNEANTGFWIGFANKQVSGKYYTFLQYFDGTKWVDAYQFESTLANKWHAVHVQAAVEGKAAVFVDGTYIAEVSRCGGTYGSNAKTALNSVIFECGNASATGNRLFLDNLKMVPVYETVVETFEDYAVGAVPHFPFTDANLATVSDAKAKTGTKSVYLADTVADQVAILRSVTRKCASLAVEFDMFPVTGQVQFRISNGTRNTGNTAYWVKFANIQDKTDSKYYTHLQYYDGTAWVSAYRFGGTLANSWHSVRVEASAANSANVFVDGLMVAQIHHCSGSYGTNAKAQIDSVIFECGDSTNASWKYYLDNVKLEPLGPLDKDFENVELSGSASSLPGYKSDEATAVVADPVNEGGKVLCLNAEGASETSYFEYGFAFCDKYTMEFDAYMENANNTLTFQVYDGRGGEDNTAYFMQFNHAYGLRVFNGRWDDAQSQVWETLNENVRLLTGVWNKIRIEINTAYEGEAVVYLNDELVGNTNVVYLKEEPVYGIHISTGAAGQSFCIDNLKVSPAPYEQLVTPDAVLENFDQMTAGTDLANIFASDTIMATVSNAKAKSGANSAELYDNSASSAAYLRVEAGATTGLTLDFDYNPAVGGMNVRITNGARSTENTAFWLAFNNRLDSGAYYTFLQYYNGSAWVDLHRFDGTLANKWTSIHVEAAANGNAVVYANGTKIGEAPRVGGSYGSAVTDVIDSATFECGSAAATGGKVYLDNVQTTVAPYMAMITPEPIVEDFSSVILSAPIEKEDHLGAEIREDPVNAGGNSLYLCDSTKAKTPYIDFSFESYNRVTLEFDVYLPTAENDVTFQLYNGSRAYSNTVFFLQFHHEYGLRLYNGSYNVLNANVKLTPQMWNTIRVEAVCGSDPKAAIYLNDTLVYTTKTAYNKKDSVNGFYIFAGNKNQSFYIDNIKATTAMEVVGNSIYLLNDLFMDELTVDAGMTLDLKGYTLNVKNLACFGSIVDTSQTNSGKLITDSMVLSDLTYMPIYDSESGAYRFFGYELNSLGARENDTTSVTYGFGLKFANVEAYKLLAAGGSGVGVNMKLAWGSNSATYAIDSELIKEYAALQAQYPTLQVAIMLQVAGLNMVEKGTVLKVTPSVKAADLTINGKVMSYTTKDGSGLVSTTPLKVTMGEQFTIADNSEKEGFPANNAIVTEDFSASGGVYGFTQIPNAVYDPDTGKVYINYTRHRDVAVNYPYDSTRVYNASTLINATSGAQLQKKYVQMKTEDTMFFTAMTKLKDGRIFAQNYVAYYLTDTSATTYSWIVDAAGNWQKVQGILTIPSELALSGPQPNTRWYRYGFSRSMVELDDGTLLASMYGPYGAIMVESKDYGLNWTYRSTIADSALGLERPYVNTDGTDITWFEPAVTRCADGTLLCVMRTWRDKPLYQARSYDNGLTWTEPTLMPGLEGKSIYPHLVLLSNGVLALSTGIPDNTIYFSYDGCGYNWDYSVTTSSGDTTGNSAIAELGYNASTGTVTLLALGDKGFNNLSASGVWGRILKVTRTHVSNPQMTHAIIRSGETRLGIEDTLQVRLDAIFNTDSCVITDGYTVEWRSMNPSIATVDQNGVVTGKAVGTAEIYAVVTYGDKTVISNKLPIVVRNRVVPIGIDKTSVSRWVLKVNQMGSVTAVAENYFGQQFVNSIINQVYINDNPNEPLYLKSNITWNYESLKPDVLKVDASTGAYRGMSAGVADLRVTATIGKLSFTKTITLIVTGDTWVTEGFEGTSLPTNATATNLVTLSTAKAYSGKQSVCINDTSTTLAPILTLKIPQNKGAVVEFMIYVESNEHAPSFGVGYPAADGSYKWENNTAYMSLLYNPLTGAQGYQAHNGTAWSNGDRSNKVPIKQWNKIRLEIATDKAYKLYINDTLIGDMPLAAPNSLLNTIFFSSGGSSYTGDKFYIDDVRYMVLS